MAAKKKAVAHKPAPAPPPSPPAPPKKRGRKSNAEKAAAAGEAPPAARVCTPEQIAKIGQLHALQARIAAECQPLVDEEMRLRIEITRELMPVPQEGTTAFELGGGWQFKVAQNYNRKLDQSLFESVFSRLPEGTATRVLRWNPALEVKEYKALPDEQRAIVDECVTATPGAPSVSIVPPKPQE